MTLKSISLRNLLSLTALATLPWIVPPAAAQQPDKVWVTHQAARLVVGQTSFTRQNPIPSQDSIGAAGGVAVAGNRLIIADGNRVGAAPISNRVLIYENLADFVPVPEATLPQDTDCPSCVGSADVVLGQTNFSTIDPAGGSGMRAPSGVSSDGQVLAVADTNNNRVLLWRNIPASNGVAPDVILGQPDANSSLPRTSRDGLRGPQGVWVADGKLFVADTQNSRILIWNNIPASSGASPDVVVGQPDFESRPEPDLTQSDYEPSAQRLLDPVGVSTKDGKMFVADLGFDRVMIYNTIPTSNNPAADVVIGQPDFTTTGFVDHDGSPFTASVRRAVVDLCGELGPFEDDGSNTPDDFIFPDPITNADPEEPIVRYARRCEASLNFPRFVISDGQKLFVADSGNDRVLVFNEIPTANGASADVVIGQPDFVALTDAAGPGNMRSPSSLALDENQNLYVADPFVRRVLVFSPGVPMVAQEGIRNGASFAIYANGWLQWEGATTDSGQLVEVNISGRMYELRTETAETGLSVRDKIMAAINADENSLVRATPENGLGIFAKSFIQFGGSVREGDLITLEVGDRTYSFTTVASDAASGPFIIVDRLNFLIDRDDEAPWVADRSLSDLETLVLVGREPGPALNGTRVNVVIPDGSSLTVQYAPDTQEFIEGSFPARIRLTALTEGRPGNAVTVSSMIGGAGVITSTSGSRLQFGSDSRHLPAGTLAAIFGEGFSDQVYAASYDANGMLPTRLGGVEVYTNGRRSPLFAVTPNQINFQVPWEVAGEGLSTWVRKINEDGSVRVSIARANEVTRAAPGVFTYGGPEPRQAVALHGQAGAEGIVALAFGSSLTGESPSAPAGVTVTINVDDRQFSYETVAGDSLETIRDRLIGIINNVPDSPVSAEAGNQGFFSARADVFFDGQPNEGDVVTIAIGGDGGDGDDNGARVYTYTVREGDTREVIRNLLVEQINAGRGDIEVTARTLIVIGDVRLQVVARSLGVEGNDIRFSVTNSSGSGVTATTNESVEESGTLLGGQTPPTVVIRAKQSGRQGNDLSYSGATSDLTLITATARTSFLCCGNEPFSPITLDNPAVPGETIIVYAAGLGLTNPRPIAEGLESGEATPDSPLFNVPAIDADFVSSRAAGRTATVVGVALAPGFVGVYQLNLKLNEQLPDDPLTPLTVEQGFFISNTATLPVKNLFPQDPDGF